MITCHTNFWTPCSFSSFLRVSASVRVRPRPSTAMSTTSFFHLSTFDPSFHSLNLPPPAFTVRPSVRPSSISALLVARRRGGKREGGGAERHARRQPSMKCCLWMARPSRLRLERLRSAAIRRDVDFAGRQRGAPCRAKCVDLIMGM